MRANRRLLLSIGHGSVDFYQGIVPVLVPFLVSERHYGHLGVSGFVLAASLLSSVVQPLFGALTDRWAMPWLVPMGTLAAGCGVALIGVTGSYPLTLAAIALTGFGVAAYHPEAARLARAVTGGDHVGMSWFSLGGNVGFALAPVLATAVLALGGLAAAPFLLAPAVLGMLVTLPLLGRRASVTAGSRTDGRDDWPAFRVLSAVVILRSIAYIGLSSFLGLFVQQRIQPGDAAGGAALFVLFTGGAVGTVLGGRLAERWGRIRTMRRAYGVATLAVAGVVLVPGPALYGFVAVVAIALYVPFSLHITLGQDYLPNRVGTAGGVTLGLAVSVGGVLAPALGALADATSLRTMLSTLTVFPALAWLLTRRLREPTRLESPRHEMPSPALRTGPSRGEWHR
ncbi:MFS transporter [Thermomonospora cellulosilytica]|uniref:FSR family fosmidomycin resistance protein-like MFS transporter n=1 Tax=Thermomonospora cellulosilytica TaxID=1411118 RepID=A0A7W3RAW1_9ACTN|nr:MFS transporter [Thermomonospora cellulosilytica]MBA9006317.1 FSR family fosmidomycin resistance protein-like MFS transporter [Thermomonospora cellulosilytica]